MPKRKNGIPKCEPKCECGYDNRKELNNKCPDCGANLKNKKHKKNHTSQKKNYSNRHTAIASGRR